MAPALEDSPPAIISGKYYGGAVFERDSGCSRLDAECKLGPKWFWMAVMMDDGAGGAGTAFEAGSNGCNRKKNNISS